MSDLQPTCNQLATKEGDLISRREAIDAVNRAVTKEAARWSIQELPSVEPRTGKWLEKEVYPVSGCIDEVQSARCSECGKYHTTPFMYYFDEYKFCPNCGARIGK